MLLHKNRPPFLKGAYMALHAYDENICTGSYAISDPSGPVCHNLLIRYLKLASGLDRNQNRNNHYVEITYCHGQVTSIIHQSQNLVYSHCRAKQSQGQYWTMV